MATTAFNDLITFSRGSNATVTGPNGLIQWAPSNLLTNSQDFEASAWLKSGTATIVANSALSPDGTITGDKLVFNSGAAPGAAYVYRAVSGLTSGISYTQSVFIKEAGVTTANIWSNISGSYTSVRINLSTGVLSQNGAQPLPASYSAISAGNGWWRVTISETTSGTSGNVVYVDTSVTGDGTNGVFIWGAQLELGSTATTYNNTSVRNLLGFSEAFDNAAWSKNGSSIVTGAAANPVNGLFNAQKLMENTAASTQHYTRQNPITVASGAVVTLSVYAKAGERRYLGLLEGYSNKGRYFDLQTGTVGNVLVGAPSSASITAVGNGWYRCSITTTAPATTVDHEIYLSADGSSLSYTGDGNSGVYIYGAQLSNSASLDPYVPTPGAAPSSTAYYGPRFDYDPVTLAARGLLVEEARTNLLLRSEEFDNATWVKTNATVTANATNAPDGTTTADRVTITGNSIGVRQTSSATASTQVRSFYVKIDSGVRFFQILTDGSVNAFANFDLLLGVIGTKGSSVSDHTITAVGNDWYRIAMVSTDAIANSTYCSPVTSASAGWSTGASSGSFFIWGAQLETGAFATSYIPTIASTVTRSADVATISGSLFSQWYNQPQGTFVVSGSFPQSNNAETLCVDDGSGANTLEIYRSSATKLNGFVRSGNVTVADMACSQTLSSGATYNTAIAYATDSFAFGIDGVAPTTDTAGAVPVAVNIMRIGLYRGNIQQVNGHIRNIRFIPARAADFQLQGRST